MAKRSFVVLILLFVAFTAALYNTARMLVSTQEQRLDLESFEQPRKVEFTKQPRVRPFHTAVSSSGSVYENWQSRIMYYWFKRFKDQAGSEMGGFTRILHSGQADDLMEEIPTFVVDPLPAGLDQGYVVLNRPWAFVQWLEKANITEDYIFMAEPDHLITKPLPNLASKKHPAAFPFFYIEPEKYSSVIKKFFDGPISQIDPIGNSPSIIRKSDLRKIAPTWHNVSLSMKKDADADKAFGWVLEMYSYAVAAAMHGIRHDLHQEFMIQPPWDTSLGETFLIHYTYGCDYTKDGVLTYGKVGEWRFDKRSYVEKPPPKNLPLPPPGVPQSVVTLVKMINEATSNFADWGY